MVNVPYMKIKDACAVIGVSTYFLRQGIRNGTIPFIRSGQTVYINVPELIRMLDEQSREGGRTC